MTINGNKNKKKDPDERVRKIGEREEIVETKLTQIQLEDMRMEVMALLDEEERIEAKKDEVAKNFTSQLKTNKLQINELRRTIAACKRRETIIVEEHLTQSNEIVRIRKDTGDRIGSRTATPRELQEPMFPDPPSDPAQQNDAPAPPDDAMEFGEGPGPG